MAGNSWQQPVSGEPSGGSWHRKANPAAAWLASKTSWSGTDSFVTAGYYLEVDFSAVVPAGTRAVRVFVLVNGTGNIAWRPKGDANISDTPFASTEYHAYGGGSGADRQQMVLWLSSDYKATFTVDNTAVDLYVSNPIEYMI